MTLVTKTTRRRGVILARYALARSAATVPVVAVVVAVTFVVTHLLPVDPAVVMAGPDASAQTINALRRQFGLNKSLGDQAVSYLSGLVHGNFGVSILTGRPVLSDLLSRMPATLLLVVPGLAIAFVIALALASAASRKTNVSAAAGRALGTLGTSLPEYVTGLTLILIFYVGLRLVPAPLGQSGPLDPSVPTRTGAYLLDAVLAGNPAAVLAGLTHIILPLATVVFAAAPPMYRVLRAAIADVRATSYFQYAVLAQSSPALQRRLLLENVAPVALTLLGVQFALMIGGSVIVETIYSWNGIGQYAVNAVTGNDYPAVEGFVMFSALLCLVAYLLVDVVHAALDPRVLSRRATSSV